MISVKGVLQKDEGHAVGRKRQIRRACAQVTVKAPVLAYMQTQTGHGRRKLGEMAAVGGQQQGLGTVDTVDQRLQSGF